MIAVIPARGGSKRIPRKNIRLLSGRPLISWSIDLCLDSGVFSDVIVSTDDEEIAHIARASGASVPFMRPPQLADDFASTVDVVAHAVRLLLDSGVEATSVCCVYPASIFLAAADFARAAELLAASPYVATITRYRHPVQRALIMAPDGVLTFAHPEYAHSRTQDLPDRWHDAGQFYWGRSQAWLDRLPILENAVGYRVDSDRVCDIDTEEDWSRAEQLHRMRAGTSPGDEGAVG